MPRVQVTVKLKGQAGAVLPAVMTRLGYAALESVLLKDRDCPVQSRSAAASHRMQRMAQGRAARRLGLIGDSHSMQTPKESS